MRPGETVRAALRGLRRRPLRNGLALVGVILATANVGHAGTGTVVGSLRHR